MKKAKYVIILGLILMSIGNVQGYESSFYIINSRLADLEIDRDNLEKRVNTLESKVYSLEDKVYTLESKNSTLERDNQLLESKVYSLESKIDQMTATERKEREQQRTIQAWYDKYKQYINIGVVAIIISLLLGVGIFDRRRNK